MTELVFETIATRLQEKFGHDILDVDETYGMLTITVSKEVNLDVIGFLKNEPSMDFNFLTDLCGIHYPELKGKELGVVYHLRSFRHNRQIRIKLFTATGDPAVNSLTPLFESANWMERETFDFYGIRFQGHPNLKRILNMDEMEYYPLLKQYPLEDQTREDKQDQYFGR
jgi:NADH-quinone oxidoreductase subunit C